MGRWTENKSDRARKVLENRSKARAEHVKSCVALSWQNSPVSPYEEMRMKTDRSSRGKLILSMGDPEMLLISQFRKNVATLAVIAAETLFQDDTALALENTAAYGLAARLPAMETFAPGEPLSGSRQACLHRAQSRATHIMRPRVDGKPQKSAYRTWTQVFPPCLSGLSIVITWPYQASFLSVQA